MTQKSEDVEDVKKHIKINEEKDDAFLNSRKDAEDLESDDIVPGWAHTPFWPAVRELVLVAPVSCH